ncbi:hypothetical protein Anas_08295 [Armadillidium nasatum]|uniref:Uncharacterized protein n=1 Tax=Armadillidium nasatum TaxID=96803 RepID=A0A5N5THD5_9CRUS|nr:hypothetical protein Anas_08295 [Armadillidium nasatum]
MRYKEFLLLFGVLILSASQGEAQDFDSSKVLRQFQFPNIGKLSRDLPYNQGYNGIPYHPPISNTRNLFPHQSLNSPYLSNRGFLNQAPINYRQLSRALSKPHHHHYRPIPKPDSYIHAHRPPIIQYQRYIHHHHHHPVHKHILHRHRPYQQLAINYTTPPTLNIYGKNIPPGYIWVGGRLVPKPIEKYETTTKYPETFNVDIHRKREGFIFINGRWEKIQTTTKPIWDINFSIKPPGFIFIEGKWVRQTNTITTKRPEWEFNFRGQKPGYIFVKGTWVPKVKTTTIRTTKQPKWGLGLTKQPGYIYVKGKLVGQTTTWKTTTSKRTTTKHPIRGFNFTKKRHGYIFINGTWVKETKTTRKTTKLPTWELNFRQRQPGFIFTGDKLIPQTTTTSRTTTKQPTWIPQTTTTTKRTKQPTWVKQTTTSKRTTKHPILGFNFTQKRPGYIFINGTWVKETTTTRKTNKAAYLGS